MEEKFKYQKLWYLIPRASLNFTYLHCIIKDTVLYTMIGLEYYFSNKLSS